MHKQEGNPVIKNISLGVILIGLLFQLMLSSTVFATNCGKLYLDKVYEEVSTRRFVYDAQRDWSGKYDTLRARVFQPVDEQQSKRPLLIYMHGGGMLKGERSEANITYLCKSMALRGYVVAAIDYRIGAQQKTKDELGNVIIRTVQDLNSFIRYSKANAATLGIDTNLVFICGNSAGAISCIYQQYVSGADYPAYIDTLALGTPAGQGNVNGHSTSVAGVYCMWGLLNDTNWIQAGDVPIGCIQAINDPCVPYDYARYSCAMFSIPAFGSNAIYTRAQHLGIYSTVHAFSSNVHNIGLDSIRYVDTTSACMAEFCYHVIHEKTPMKEDSILNACPNPCKNTLNVNGIGDGFFDIYNEKGKKVMSAKINESISVAALAPGWYTLKRKWSKVQAKCLVHKI